MHRRLRRPRRPRHLVAAALALLALGAPSAALARGGDDELRVGGTCTRGASAELRLKADDGAIEVELRVDVARSRQRWRVVLVHERRVAWRGSARAHGDSFRIRRSLPDYGGADQVTVLASGPRGASCRAGGVLSGS